MGLYDMLPKGSQVKCWTCEMRQLKMGDYVPVLNLPSEYIVLLREGGYIRVDRGMIVEIVEIGRAHV